MRKDSFADLEKVRLSMLQEKLKNGIEEFESNQGQKWAQIRLEKPLLETLLTLVEKESYKT